MLPTSWRIRLLLLRAPHGTYYNNNINNILRLPTRLLESVHETDDGIIIATSNDRGRLLLYPYCFRIQFKFPSPNDYIVSVCFPLAAPALANTPVGQSCRFADSRKRYQERFADWVRKCCRETVETNIMRWITYNEKPRENKKKNFGFLFASTRPFSYWQTSWTIKTFTGVGENCFFKPIVKKIS